MSTTLVINGRSIAVDPGPSLFDCAERLGVAVPTSCHKQGKCRECLVEVVEGMEHLSPRTFQEEQLEGIFRLACRSRIAAANGTVRCHTLRRAAMQIEQEGMMPTARGKPPRLDPAVTRDGDRVLLDGAELTRAGGPLHGIALDLGTTTVVLRLFDLESGRLIARSSFENPQRFGGSNVMARIAYDTSHKGKLLQRTLVGYLTHAIETFPVDPQTIYEMVVAGNTTMRDLFFRLDVHPIGQKPYCSTTELDMRAGRRASTGLSMKARRLGLPIHRDARVVGLPLIASHVGADAAAGLLAIDMPHEERLVAFMDIGTNTELIVGNRHRLMAAPCPAGPAFEGGAISCGMPALDGAIEGIRLGDDGSVERRVVGDVTPIGVCGSGLIDILSELLRTQRMNARGRLNGIARSFAIDTTNGLALSERDIGELAQAKGASTAGLQIILKRYGVSPDELETFYVAGGFGQRLNADAARRIGLIPDVADARLRQLGNAAIEGASIALLSMRRRRELETLVRSIVHVPLGSDPAFFDLFTEGCQFGRYETATSHPSVG